VRGQRAQFSTAIVVLTIALGLAASAAAADWPRYGGDDLMTNAVPPERTRGISAASARWLQELWSTKLDGKIYASPLYAQGVEVAGFRQGLVYAFTEAGTVYALRADDGDVVWQRQLGAVTVDGCAAEGRPAPVYGISSTGLIDRTTNRLYVVGATGLLYALDLGTGAVVPGWPVQVVDRPDIEHVWSGLTLVGSRLYVAVASYCDRLAPDGRVAEGGLVAVDVDAARLAASYDVVPGIGNLGGIWGYGGVSVDPLTGHLWTATGNSWVYDATCDCIVENAGQAEAVVELDPTLAVVAWSRPQPAPPVEDNDFGSTPLLFQPPGCPPLAAAQAKDGFVYVWKRDALGAGPIWSAHIGPTDLANPFIGQPSYSADLNMLFVSDARDYGEDGTTRSFDAIVAFAVGPGCSLPDRPTWTLPDVGRGPKAPPLVVDDALFVPGGLYPDVFALDARSGGILWRSTMPGPVLCPPAFANGTVLFADVTGTLSAFGLEHNRGSRRPISVD
jgi:outer membrane protein assembly factor BamB